MPFNISGVSYLVNRVFIIPAAALMPICFDLIVFGTSWRNCLCFGVRFAATATTKCGLLIASHLTTFCYQLVNNCILISKIHIGFVVVSFNIRRTPYTAYLPVTYVRTLPAAADTIDAHINGNSTQSTGCGSHVLTFGSTPFGNALVRLAQPFPVIRRFAF